METCFRSLPRFACGLFLTIALTAGALAQGTSFFSSLQVLTNKEALLRLALPTGKRYQLETSTNLLEWSPLSTFNGAAAATQFQDAGTPYLPSRYYRVAQIETNNPAAVGDIITTADGEVIIQAIYHASLVMSWKGIFIYVDPTQGASRYTGIPRADLVLITHAHGDHFDPLTLTSIKGTNTLTIAPASVQTALASSLKTNSIPLANGQTHDFKGIKIEAFPMYNFTSQNHLKGVGNGYILTIGGKRFYIGGDTEDTPEMRALRDLEVAFVPMNSFTMSVNKAAEAVKLMRPRIVFPYHYQGSDVNTFKRLMGTDTGIEVRLRKWY